MLIIDAAVLYSAADRRDRHHDACRDLLTGSEPPLIVPVLALAEAAYLMAKRLGPQSEAALAASVAEGELIVDSVADGEWARVYSLVNQYLDLPLGIADASIIALTERLSLTRIASFDRHLAIVRPLHTATLTLVLETNPQPSV